MLAALLEWFLWVAAFLYCLVKVFQKAETLSIRILAVIMMIAFTSLRYATEGQHLVYLLTLALDVYSCPSWS